MIRDREFYKTFFKLTFSLALTSLLAYSVNLMDNLMLGGYSENALSGASLCNQYQYLLQMVVVAAADGVMILGTQYWGKKNLKPISHIVGVGMRYALGFAIILWALVFFFPQTMLGLITNQQAVLDEAVSYIRIVCFSYIFFAATSVLLGALRTVGIVKVGYIISTSTLCINVCINYILIYGHFGAPRLGIRGAAIATLISRIVELCIVILYLKFREHNLNLNLRKLVQIDHSYNKDYLRTSMALMTTQFLWGIAQMVQTAILGHLGAAPIAANAIAVIVYQIVSVVAFGSAGAASILVGKTIGENRMDYLKTMVRTMQILFLMIGICTGLIIFLARYPILTLYDISPEAESLANRFMIVLSITTVGTSYQAICDTGIIRGGGDTRFSMIMNQISQWGIIVPLASLGAFVFQWPAMAVFFILKSDQIFKCLPVGIRLNSWKWIKKVTREEIK